MTDLIKAAIDLASRWNRAAAAELSEAEQAEKRLFSRLVEDDNSKLILTYLFDQAFRSNQSSRTTNQFQFLLKKYGTPQYLGQLDKFLIQMFLYFGHLWPDLSMFMLKRKIRQDTKTLVLNQQTTGFQKLVRSRQEKSVSLNWNLLGETVLGEIEANNRLKEYQHVLSLPEIEYLSIKLSNLFAQFHPLGYERSKKLLIERLSSIYRAAKAHKSAQGAYKFVNLDMEEYKDLELTIDVFTATLDQPEFKDYRAGIVLQAYLPDAALWQKRLIAWAKKRVLLGGSPIKMRLVKGANLQMEKVDSSLHGWASPVFPTKILVDANFKAMLEVGLEPDNIPVVHLGIGSHNLFDIAYATLLAKHNQIEKYFTLEMLEGMSEGLRRVLVSEHHKLVMYAPIAGEKTFLQGVGYLIRRLDENSGPENFLRFSFGLKQGSQSWQFLQDQFLQAHALKSRLNHSQRRQQSAAEPVQPNFAFGDFHNEPDTDFYLPKNRAFAFAVKKSYQKKPGEPCFEIPVLVAGQPLQTAHFWDFFDVNASESVHLYRLYLSGLTEIDSAIEVLHKDLAGWRKQSLEGRYAIIRKVAQGFRQKRGHLLGLMAQVTGKVFTEGDVEITEAIDFAEYYPASFYNLLQQTGAKAHAKGIVLVLAPWNFPTAIPAGGVLAALTAGNSVILKPAPEAAVIGVELAKIFWEAGVPDSALQVINCQENEDLEYLATHKDIAQIIFTGGIKTAERIITSNPTTPLSAETGGKNATIITDLADEDLAIKNVIHSAFSNGGQKCSATSLLILPPSLFHSQEFKYKILDAAQSYKTGSAWNLENFMGPLIQKPSGALAQTLDKLENDECWWLQPEFASDNPRLLTPGIKWGVQAGSHSHLTEFFGPLLSVMEAKDFETAIDLANQTEYGLTSGLESLDEREQALWLEKIEAGNLYINRGTTGAIVQRQPFGGMKKSAFGAGIKAGGPNYCLQLAHFEGTAILPPAHYQPLSYYTDYPTFAKLFAPIQDSLSNYPWRMDENFERKVDCGLLLGQDNWLVYKKGIKFGLRLQAQDGWESVLRIALALAVARAEIYVSVDPEFVVRNSDWGALETFLTTQARAAVLVEKESVFLQLLSNFQRLRTATQPGLDFYQAAAAAYKPVIAHAPYADGRIELPFYLQEQSISHTYHRYGNLLGHPEP